MSQQYTIGQLAKVAGIPISTVRYYEREGLLQPAKRADNNYRVYSNDLLQRLRFIRAAQATGFTLDDVRALLAFCDGDMALCKDIQPLIAQRLAAVSQRLQSMQHIQHILQSMLAMCHRQDQEALCHLIDALTDASL